MNEKKQRVRKREEEKELWPFCCIWYNSYNSSAKNRQKKDSGQ